MEVKSKVDIDSIFSVGLDVCKGESLFFRDINFGSTVRCYRNSALTGHSILMNVNHLLILD